MLIAGPSMARVTMHYEKAHFEDKLTRLSNFMHFLKFSKSIFKRSILIYSPLLSFEILWFGKFVLQPIITVMNHPDLEPGFQVEVHLEKSAHLINTIITRILDDFSKSLEIGKLVT